MFSVEGTGVQDDIGKHVSYSLKGGYTGTILGVIKGDNRSLDHSSCRPLDSMV